MWRSVIFSDLVAVMKLSMLGGDQKGDFLKCIISPVCHSVEVRAILGKSR
jgi:hypothetical protein